MPNDLLQLIIVERERIRALHSALDAERTPYLKGQLRMATHHLDDAEGALRRAGQGSASNDAAMWMEFAAMNL
jgi:hypothetical protein